MIKRKINTFRSQKNNDQLSENGYRSFSEFPFKKEEIALLIVG